MFKNAVSLFCLVLVLGCPAIPIVPTGDEVADCAKEAGKDIFYTLQPQISTLVSTSDSYPEYAAGLLPLVSKFGIALVTCVVESVLTRNTQSAGIATGSEKQLHVRNAEWSQRWLGEKGAALKAQ